MFNYRNVEPEIEEEELSALEDMITQAMHSRLSSLMKSTIDEMMVTDDIRSQFLLDNKEMFEHAVNNFTETSDENEKEARTNYEQRLQRIIEERTRSQRSNPHIRDKYEVEKTSLKLIARERATIEKEWELKKEKIHIEAEKIRQQQEQIKERIDRAMQQKVQNQ